MMIMMWRLERMQRLRETFSSRWLVWIVFIACLLVSQAVNPWATLPDYGGWYVLGFPLVYYQYQYGSELVYFNILFLLADLMIWYVVARGIIFGHRQLTKYRIMGS